MSLRGQVTVFMLIASVLSTYSYGPGRGAAPALAAVETAPDLAPPRGAADAPPAQTHRERSLTPPFLVGLTLGGLAMLLTLLAMNRRGNRPTAPRDDERPPRV